MKKMRFLAGMLRTGCAALILLCTGCSNYDFSTDYVQIGCRVNTGKEVQETAYSRIGFPWWFDNNGNAVLYGLDISPFIYDNGTLNGLGIALGSMRNKTNGILLSPICSIQGATRGVSFSPVNVLLREAPGVQAGLWNHAVRSFICDGDPNGPLMQLGILNGGVLTDYQIGICNYCAIFCDLQFGLVNAGTISREPHWKRTFLQIGLFNFSENGVIQIGLLNINENSAFCKWFPLVNFAGESSGNGR